MKKILFILIAFGTAFWLHREMHSPSNVSKPLPVSKNQLTAAFAKAEAKLEPTALEPLRQGLSSSDLQVRAAAVRYARALLILWVDQNEPQDWTKDEERNRFFAQLYTVQDEEFQKFKELNPNSRAMTYLRQLSRGHL